MSSPDTDAPATGGRPARGWHLAGPIAALPALAAALAFLPALGNGFVFWDDPVNILDNVHLRAPFWSSLGWAWTTTLLHVYQPLAWTLFRAEHAAWGLRAGGYHLASLLLHALNAALACRLSAELLGRAASPQEPAPDRRAVWIGSVLGSMLWAVHPLRTEVVAWVSCQPYLPCASCAMLCVLAYLRAVDSPPSRQAAWLAASVALFVAAMLFKAAAVALPLVLLILDAYPLGRLRMRGHLGDGEGAPARRALVEKWPYFAAALAFAVVGVVARGDPAGTEKVHRIGPRVAQAFHSATFYLEKTIWPSGLTNFYPYPERLELLAPPYLARAALVVGLSAAAICLRRRWPGLAATWGAYLALLAPNAGLARFGPYLAADRYSYLPTLAAAPALAALLARGGRRRWAWPAALGVVLGLATLSRTQCGIWHDSERLWTHARRHGGEHQPTVTGSLALALLKEGRLAEAVPFLLEWARLEPASAEAHDSLGRAYANQGRLPEAAGEFAEAVRLDPSSAMAARDLGKALLDLGDPAGGAPHLARAIRLEPGLALAHNDLGIALARQGRPAEAIGRFAEALRLEPGNAEAHNNLGMVLAQRGRVDEAIAHYREALRLAPGDAEARNNLGVAFASRGEKEHAAAEFAEAVRLAPRFALARANLARALSHLGRREEAVGVLEQAVRLDPDDPGAHARLADALAGAGRLREAEAALAEAVRLAPDEPALRRRLDDLRAAHGRPAH